VPDDEPPRRCQRVAIRRIPAMMSQRGHWPGRWRRHEGVPRWWQQIVRSPNARAGVRRGRAHGRACGRMALGAPNCPAARRSMSVVRLSASAGRSASTSRRRRGGKRPRSWPRRSQVASWRACAPADAPRPDVPIANTHRGRRGDWRGRLPPPGRVRGVLSPGRWGYRRSEWGGRSCRSGERKARGVSVGGRRMACGMGDSILAATAPVSARAARCTAGRALVRQANCRRWWSRHDRASRSRWIGRRSERSSASGWRTRSVQRSGPGLTSRMRRSCASTSRPRSATTNSADRGPRAHNRSPSTPPPQSAPASRVSTHTASFMRPRILD
jgi:hypothetical protein